MSHSQTHEYGILAQASELLSEEDLEKLIREKHKIDFITYEHLEVGIDDPSRHTAVLITPGQAKAIAGQENGNAYVWEHHQYPLKDGSIFELQLPTERGFQIMHCLTENPFRGSGATRLKALTSAYQEWVLVLNKTCPKDTPVSLNGMVTVFQEQRDTEPEIGIEDFQKLQQLGSTSLKTMVESGPKFH